MKIRILLFLVMVVLLSACEQVDQVGSGPTFESKGKKLMPPKPLTNMVLVDDQNNALPIDLLQNSYHYVLLAESACDEFCMQYINLTREVIQQTSADNSAPMPVSKPVSKPVKQLLVLGYEPDKAWLEKLKQDNPNMIVAILTPPIWAIFTLPFNQVATDMLGAPLYLVDSRGLIMIVYDDLDEAAPLINDLKFLDAKL